MKQKRGIIVAIACSTLILFTGGFAFTKLVAQHQENERTIEKCFEKFNEDETIAIEKSGLFSPINCTTGE